jgi:serine/threonine protein kinase
MVQTGQQAEPGSIKREYEREYISVEELYRKFQQKDLDYKVFLVRENPYGQEEIFEIVGILGSGRSCYVFLALMEKKLVSLRMSNEKADFRDKFDSVRVEMEDDYDDYFLNILYPSVPVDFLCIGNVRKKNKLFFDRKVYASFWEKADASMLMKIESSFEDKFRWFRQCLKGLSIIHSRGRAHFDIKLENLFLVDNRLKIGDFEYYLKIEDFIYSGIYYCGTPGYIAPEMFYDRKKVSERIDIFSAGVAFARFFTGVETPEEPDGALNIDGDVVLSAEEEKEFAAMFNKYQGRLLNKKIKNTFRNNFRKFNFYRTLLQSCLEDPGTTGEKREVFAALLEMMSPDPDTRPDAGTVLQELEKNRGTGAAGSAAPRKTIQAPVFKIDGTPLAVVNLTKKNDIEIGGVKRKKNPAGRDFNDIDLRFVDISRRHLRLTYIPPRADAAGERIEICDLDSTHGVFLNNEKLNAGTPRQLLTGDIIQLGNIISFRFTREDGYFLLQNITRQRKKGNLLWLDKEQLDQLPDLGAAIILLTGSVSLAAFGVSGNTALIIDEKGGIQVKGKPLKGAVIEGVVL